MENPLKNLYHIITYYVSTRTLAIIGLLVIVLIIPLTVFIAQKQQEVRQRASSATTIALSPATTSATVGQSITFDIMVDPGQNVIGGVKLQIIYNPAKFSAQENALLIDPSLFPNVTPAFAFGTITAEMVVADPTKALQSHTKIGSVTLTPITSDAKDVVFGTDTQLFTLAASDSAATNVLSTTIPASIQITTDTTPTPSPPVLTSPTALPTTSPSTTQPPTPTALPTPAVVSDRYGVNTGILVPEEPYTNSALSYASSLGVGWIRLSNDWFDLEPIDNNWNFSVSDTIIDAARLQGLNILYMFDPDLNGKFCTMSPAEASSGTKTKCTDEQFTEYIRQIVSRYKGKVTYYELGNEPDLRATWRNDAAEYARALALAYTTLKNADPNAKLLIGGLAASGGQQSNGVYLDALLNDPQNPILQNFDIFNYHTYAKKQDIGTVFSIVTSKVPGKPVWITEVGFPDDPTHQEQYRSGYGYPSGEDGQAAYLQDVLPYLLSLGAEKVFWYTLVDVPRDDSQFCRYGLIYVQGEQCIGSSAGRTTTGNLATKKAYTTYKQVTGVAPTTIPPTDAPSASPTEAVPTISPTITKPTPAHQDGDANEDGAVNILDFNAWKDEYIGVSQTQQSDFNADGKVDLRDFNTWRNYGFTP